MCSDTADVLMDLESPASSSKGKRSSSLRSLGALVMQDTNAFIKEEPEARRMHLQFPPRQHVSLHAPV